MRKHLILMLSVLSLIVASCSKSRDDAKPDSEKQQTKITINGTVYATTIIGSQTWTTVNYNGSGGVNYNDDSNDATYGKLYSYNEVKALTGLPTGWRVPTEADVKALLATVGTKLDGSKMYIDAAASQKLMSTTGWTSSSMAGTNSTGLNLVPTGYLFMSSASSKSYSNKGMLASFWTSSNVQDGTDSSPLLFEVSSNSYDSNDQAVGLRGSIYNTTASGDGSSSFPAEKRSIRFVKDN